MYDCMCNLTTFCSLLFEKEKEQKFRVNRAGPYINVQALGMYVELMCSFELPFVAKAITGRILRESLW